MPIEQKTLKSRRIVAIATALSSRLTLASSATAAQLKVIVENLAPEEGNFLTPVWAGFHNGEFDSYDQGASLDSFPGSESVAEDGLTEQISNRFEAVGAGEAQGTILGAHGPIAPGETATMTFEVDGNLPSSQYFSYASMVIPSNDAFIANGNPLANQVFDDVGNFIGPDFIVPGSQVLDAGTEVNDVLQIQHSSVSRRLILVSMKTESSGCTKAFSPLAREAF